MFETLVVRANDRSGGIIGISFRFFKHKSTLCVFIRSTHTIPFSIMKKKRKLPSAAMEFFQGTQERVRNSRGKRVISVRATDGLCISGALGQFSASFTRV